MDAAPDWHRERGRADGRAFRLVLPRRALRGAMGDVAGTGVGESLEFQDYRDYAPGDDLRNLDWNVLARTDRAVVKIRREEVAPFVEIRIDGSGSMSVPPAKGSAAEYVAGVVAGAAPSCRVVERPITNLEPSAFAKATADRPTTNNEPPARGLRIVVSDLMTVEDPGMAVARLARGAAALVVVRVLAREEAEPPESGAFELCDSETGERRAVDFAAARAGYLKSLAEHTERWRAAVRRVGGVFADVVAESSGRDILAALASARVIEARG